MCHFACTIDSAESERDLVLISGMLPSFKALYKMHTYFFDAQFMQCILRGIPGFFAQRLSQSIVSHLAGTCLYVSARSV